MLETKSANPLKCQFERDLQVRLEAFQQVAQGFAHEIRNPIHVMINAGKLMEREIKDWTDNNPEDANSFADQILRQLDMIMQGSTRLNLLVKRLWEGLSYRRNEHRFVDLNQLISDELEKLLLEHAESCQNIEIIQSYDTKIPLLFICPEAMSLVLANLVRNSIQAIDEARISKQDLRDAAKRRRIEISTCFYGGEVRIEVVDEGIGLDHLARHKMFEPFFSTKKPGDGLGIGLALSYQIITEDFGGQIEAVQTQDKKTKFSVYLPFQQLSGCQRQCS